ncbi:MAG TPA: amino acid adenylation domain-containing protein [Pyrinomonadaceae bacterium]|nr:amino acid adenylation domain-containing protein [Pyrinomonadaceae bacterium]
MSAVKDFYPLSPMQEGMLFHSLMDSGSGVYVKQVTYALNGELNIPALEQAWQDAVDRFAILRTFFVWEDLKNPVQVVQANVKVTLHREDWSNVPEAEVEQRVKEYAEADRVRGFDISQPPLMRMALISLDKEHHRLVWTWHHILIDGWSEGLLDRAVFELFSAHCTGRKPQLARSRPFRDYIRWIQQQELPKTEAFWRRTLQGFTRPSTLARSLSTNGHAAYQRKRVLVSEATTTALNAFVRKHHLTLSTLLKSVWSLILAKHCNQDDVVFGSVVSGRPPDLEGVENIIGMFVNTLPVRIRIARDQTLLSWLSDVQTQQAETLQYEHSPLQQIQKWSDVPRGLPLFESLMSFDMSQLETSDTTRTEEKVNIKIDVGSGGLQISNPLSILVQTGAQLFIGMSYDPRLFADDTIDQLLTDFNRLIENFIAYPERSLSSFLAQIGPDRAETDELAEMVERSNLTRNQFMIWLGQKLNGDVPLYNIPCIIKFSGHVEPDHVRNAWRTLVNSSDALRTIVEEDEAGAIRQRVLPSVNWDMEQIDFSREPDPAARFSNWLRERTKATLPVNECLVDSALIKMSDRAYTAYYNTHQMISDAWSGAMIARQMLVFYERSLNGELSENHELGQFSDYVEHERKLRTTPQYQDAQDFWRRELSEEVEPLAFYGKQPVKHSAEVERIVVDLGPERTQRLKEIAGSEGVFQLSQELTLFSIFVSLASAFLHRITGTPRIPLGVYYHNRNGFRDTIGLFMSVHPLRIGVEDGDTFKSLIKRTQSEYRRVSKYRNYPVANPARKPAYDVLVNYVNQTAPLSINGTTVNYEWLFGGHGGESLTLELLDYKQAGSFEVGFRFHRDVFGEQRRRDAIRHFLQIFDCFLEDSSQRVAFAALLTEREREQLVVRFNQTRREYAQDQTVVGQFESQAEHAPEKIALEVDGRTLSYAELNARANQLAHKLRRLGVGQETVVGVCTERSLELIIGILGVLKAGGAFVPLDPNYPRERLGFMLDDSRCEVLLTQEHLMAGLAQHEITTICLDSDWSQIEGESTANPVDGPAVDNLAYVIYTSGSTGKPKGTMIQHGSLFDYTQTVTREYAINADDRILQFCSLSFDTSIEEIVPCLANGATLVLRTEEMLASVPTFFELCEKWAITFISLPTAYWHELTEVADSSGHSLPTMLRMVVIAGERVLPERLTAWQRIADRPLLINTYGLTESTIVSTAIELSHLPFDGGEVPIGGPINNTQLYVVDKNFEPVPVNMPGELTIGGNLLARGYYRRPDVTAERFVPNPFSSQPGARLYRTGDLSKFPNKETLEFIGRRDHQVKIRGFRIELEEVAGALRQHPNVRDCAVVLREDTPGRKQLIAYIVPRQQPATSSSDLREFLAKDLPDYMLPAVFMTIDALPLTPNGKVDLSALPAPTRSDDNVYAGPLTRIERDLGEIWASVLGLDRVGIHDNYFELGGDSIRSIQIRAKAQRLGIEFTIQDLFQQQTIGALARVSKLRDPSAIPVPETEPFSLLTDADREKLPEGVEDAFPLARLQAGMVFHNLYHENSDLYIDVSSLNLQLPYDLNAMERAINHLIARHPILRTTFDLTSFSEPLQLVWPESPCPLTIEDLREMNKEDQDELFAKWLYAEARRQFDLTKVPLIRFTVHRRSDTSFQFTWANHHAILDGWSMAVMLTELFQLYLANQSGKESKIGPPPSVSYREFVALEREVLNSKEAQQYLSETVRGLTVTTMPRRPGVAQQRIPEVITLSVMPPAELCEELKQLASAMSIPVKSFVLAAQMKMLSMVSGQSDVTTGMVVSGRPEREDGDRVLGLFTNTVPVRMNLTGGTWMELVKDVFDLEGELLPYRRFPISELKTLEGGQILFETMFNFTHFFLYKTVPRVSGAQVFDVKIIGASNYVFVTDCNQDFSSSQFELALSYDSSLVDEQQTEVVRGYFLKILESIVKDPHGRYELMSLLSENEREQLVVDWNNTAVEYADEKPIHNLFEEQAERMGNALAVVYEDQQLTYAELNRRANQLAHHLRRHGVGPEVLVGVAAERSVELMVALLGILKAGGAYVPIDPSYPASRVEYMLADSGVSIVLTQSHLLPQLPQTSARMICLDDWSEIAAEADENPAVNVSGDNSIYMIYTSGSTGQPKGALNTHSALFNRLTWMQQQYQLTPEDRVLQKTPFSFDVSVWEFFWPVITGARLVFAKPGGHQDRSYLIELINATQITTCHFVPSMLHAFLDDPEESTCRSLRQVMSSGEALSYDLQQRFFERLGARLHNLYGPTEAAIDVTFWECGPNEEHSVPIGRPIANTEIYLLDPSLHPVPVGAPGELYIGGVGLARAYHHRPELTAQQFVPHPFSETSSRRLYKTGDLARYRADGAIEYIGRSDHQVKIRGFRIELGEIEAALRECDNVKDLLVQTQQDTRGDVMLVAYIVYDHEPAPAPADIREFLKHKLPEYMVPSAFVMMSSFPLTANGKINRRALATMRPERLEVERAFVAPRTPLELRLVAIWEEVFKVHPIGVEDSFFDLGGHSILALRLMARVQKEFGQNLPLSTLTEAGDIAHLADIISKQGVAAPQSPIVPIQPKGSKQPLFCVHPLGGHVLRFYGLAQRLGLEQPFYGVQGRDMADIGEDYQSLEEMASVYIKAMRETQPVGPYQIGGYSFGSFVAFEMAQQLVRAGEEVSLLYLLDTWSPTILRLLPDLDKDALLLSVVAKEVAMRMGRTDFEVSVSELETREGDAQLSFFLEQVRKGGLVTDDIPDDIGIMYLRRLLTGIRTRGAAWRNYEPDVYPSKITVIRCAEQEPFLYNTLAEHGADVEDPTAGWRWLSEEPVEVHFVPGYHERMMMEPAVSDLAKVLAECAERPFVRAKAAPGIANRVLSYFRR